MNISIHNRVPREDLALGLVRAEGVSPGPAPAALHDELDQLIEDRSARELEAAGEALRKGSRDILRNGKYKPSGRGKPANEYLMREAAKGTFPRINGPVDANNLVSLQACVPISLWDLVLAGDPPQYEVRLGAEDEAYVFNSAGQTLALRDLVCGCALTDAGSTPLVTPIKDGLASKLTAETTRVGGCIYYPLSAGSREHLEETTRALARWLGLCGQSVQTSWALVLPGESTSL